MDGGANKTEVFLDGLFSTAAKNIRPSPLLELLDLGKEPGTISFAVGMPDPDIFPIEQLQKAASVISREGKNILQYGAAGGYPPLKDFLAEWTAPRMGRKLSTSELLITAGSAQVIDLLCWALLDRGDWVICEEPTFQGATGTMFNHGARFLTVPCDSEGMKVELLPERIERIRAAGEPIKFIYTIVNFHNPLGCDLSLQRRARLLEIARTNGIMILEDDPYGWVRFEGEDTPSLFSMDDSGLVVFSSTFSKILAPGTRVAWCAGRDEIIRKMTVLKENVDTCTSVLAQAIVWEYCRLGYLDSFLPSIIDHYRKKRDGMEAALKKYLPLDRVSWQKPGGGFFYWLTVPGIPAVELLEKALEKKVAFVPGNAFYPTGSGGLNNFRMCFTFASAEMTDLGVRYIGEAIREFERELDLKKS
ncbi:MAG: PLP-dependent aminotransferase family protein [Thermovirgaceae bacterium]|nr:PLP-dependent aminotransferase family protein [Synergistales bacterium]HPC75827.1 PLP-dependent aminotransferase family protein [Synergistales bacterium]HRS48615.1 PLP-dependent aminotransferase family protein [Thermovirgaceae bacterium]HRU90796.1 PLP-dependent aminotransferase family protein [Thermovirgaceae bacterium]